MMDNNKRRFHRITKEDKKKRKIQAHFVSHSLNDDIKCAKDEHCMHIIAAAGRKKKLLDIRYHVPQKLVLSV